MDVAAFSCGSITFENHVVDSEGINHSMATALGLVVLEQRVISGVVVTRWRIGARHAFDTVMLDPNNKLHPSPCTCARKPDTHQF